MFKTKAEQIVDGILGIRRSSRIVVCDNAQNEDAGFSEAFSPVPKLTSKSKLIAVGSKCKLLFEQVDVVAAFSNGKLKEEDYMEQQ